MIGGLLFAPSGARDQPARTRTRVVVTPLTGITHRVTPIRKETSPAA